MIPILVGVRPRPDGGAAKPKRGKRLSQENLTSLETVKGSAGEISYYPFTETSGKSHEKIEQV